MTDVAPELWAKLEKTFDRNVKNDKRITDFTAAMKKETTKAEDAALYAMYLGECASAALKECITYDSLPNGRLYWNIGQKVIKPLYKKIHTMVNEAAVTVMNAENKRSGIGVKASPAPFPESRVDDLIGKLVEITEEAEGES